MAGEPKRPGRMDRIERAWRDRPLSFIIGAAFVGLGIGVSSTGTVLPVPLAAGLLIAIGLLSILGT